MTSRAKVRMGLAVAQAYQQSAAAAKQVQTKEAECLP